MKIIDKAWKENLKLNKEDQYENKEEIIHCECVCGNHLKITLDEPKYCDNGVSDKLCVKCWNREVEEDKEDKEEYNNLDNDTDIKKYNFKDLEYSPLSSICLDAPNEKSLIESLKNNKFIVYTEEQEELTYDKIPLVIEWLQKVYDYCTELNNKVEYVDFNTAKKFICDNDGVAECNGTLYDKTSNFTIDVIDSDKWILINE